jgi:hypothetical protein
VHRLGLIDLGQSPHFGLFTSDDAHLSKISGLSQVVTRVFTANEPFAWPADIALQCHLVSFQLKENW